MTLDQLRYFVAAARLQHVGKAAKASNISPSAVSSAISAIEEELGVPLFERRGKGIVLNQHGRRLEAWASEILGQFETVQARITGSQNLAGTYRVGASHFLASHVLAEAWCALQAEHPYLIGSLRAMDTSSTVKELLEGHLDAAICVSPLSHPNLESRTLYAGQLVVAVRSGHPLLESEEASVSAVSDYPMVMFQARPGVDSCEAHPVFEAYGIAPRVQTYFDDDHVAVRQLERSDAWALLPDIVVHVSPGICALAVPEGWRAPYTVSLLHYPGSVPEHFIDALERTAKQSIPNVFPPE